MQKALETRSVIDAAAGMVMVREGISLEEAFDKLVQISQQENVKLRKLAEKMTAEFQQPASTA